MLRVGPIAGHRWRMVKAFRFAALLVLLLVAGCAALGLGTPRSRAIPVATKEDPDFGHCASSGYEVDLPPHATVAFVASTCIRPFDAGAQGAPVAADAGGGSEL